MTIKLSSKAGNLVANSENSLRHEVEALTSPKNVGVGPNKKIVFRSLRLLTDGFRDWITSSRQSSEIREKT